MSTLKASEDTAAFFLVPWVLSNIMLTDFKNRRHTLKVAPLRKNNNNNNNRLIMMIKELRTMAMLR